MDFINVILSGGVGSRLWPLSRKSRPKQYVPMFEGQTLFGMCVARNKAVVDSLMVVGSVDNYELSRADLRAQGVVNCTELIEAEPRNTAASIAFAAFAARPDDILLVTPSDHIITGEAAYKAAVAKARRLAENGSMVTFGATPTRPETGFGYIEYDGEFNVLSFKEKPSREKAESYVNQGNFLWNSGMFCFRADIYLSELARYAPDIFQHAKKAFDNRSGAFLPQEESSKIPALSVDYAVMEHSQIIRVVPYDFGWSDLGSFESVWDYMVQNGLVNEKNLVLGTQKHVEFIGLEDLILVETDDAILVVPKHRSQEVKQVYERLQTENPALLK